MADQQQQQQQQPDVKPDVGVDAKASSVIQIFVKSSADEKTAFKIKPTAALGKMMDAYAKLMSLDLNAFHFSFDGNKINRTNTAQEMEIEDGDEIEVHIKQTGGSVCV